MHYPGDGDCQQRQRRANHQPDQEGAGLDDPGQERQQAGKPGERRGQQRDPDHHHQIADAAQDPGPHPGLGLGFLEHAVGVMGSRVDQFDHLTVGIAKRCQGVAVLSGNDTERLRFDHLIRHLHVADLRRIG